MQAYCLHLSYKNINVIHLNLIQQNTVSNSGAHAHDKIRAQDGKSKDHGVIAVHPEGKVAVSPNIHSKLQM